MPPLVLPRVRALALLLAAVPVAVAAPPFKMLSRAATLAVPGGQLQGALTFPAQPDCPPLVLMLAGSGPTDRDGNSALLPGRSDSLKQLAQALAALGIATLRYDKRGVAASRQAAPDESVLRPATHAADAAAWVRQLRGQRRYASVTILGHSEGSLIGMLAARDAGADAFISVAGPAQTASMLLRRQWLPKLAPDLARATGSMLASLEQGKPRAPGRPELQAVFRPSIQPYMMSWFRYVPADEFAKLRIPMLIVQGTADMQVGVDQAWRLKRAQPDAQMALVSGMDHVLKIAPADRAQSMASYTNPSWPLAPSLVQAVAGFVHQAPTRHACKVSGAGLFAAAPG
ncbi:alpha/beta fold hydrolase [Duganella sp. FT92W]|uniref:Alpha/beta fold hydrolase n=1 Tax=Pseudoduganella rivuli TaxID=2666085 RepID=A0A7X2IK97_9BURK|nr:alpha/beta fold hydrolase [Pseudoduganella rivuli]MRV71562.1 alpha/beta fold hydrolase [Pseudoduganella rivuli]